MSRMIFVRFAVAAGYTVAALACSGRASETAQPEPAATSESGVVPSAEGAVAGMAAPPEAAAMPGIPGGPSFRPAGDRAAQAAEIRGFLDEIRPLATGCSGSVTIRSLVMYGSGAETQMMRLPPAPRPCEALTAEIQLWESRLVKLETGS